MGTKYYMCILGNGIGVGNDRIFHPLYEFLLNQRKLVPILCTVTYTYAISTR